MAGIDACIDRMREDGKELFDCFVQRLDALRKNLRTMGRCIW